MHVAGQSRLLGDQYVAQNLQSQLHLLREEGFVLRSHHGAGEWACTQSMFEALGILEVVTLRRVLCLRRRPNECWADHMKRIGVIVARQLKKHNQPRLQTLAMRRVRIAAWQMVSCPSGAKGRGYWEESVTWRCDEMWRNEYIKLSKEDYWNSMAVETPSPN